jgi:hypothetical protein
LVLVAELRAVSVSAVPASSKDSRKRAASAGFRKAFDQTTSAIAAIDNGDDFCLDEDAGFAYVTRHRANTVDRVPLAPRSGSEVRHIAGDPLDEVLVGPSSAAWRRGPEDRGRVAYVTTDGGTTAPPDGIVRKAALLRLGLEASDRPA